MNYEDLSLVAEILKDAGADERILATCPRVASLLYDLGDVLEGPVAEIQAAMEGGAGNPDVGTLPALLANLDECVKGAEL